MSTISQGKSSERNLLDEKTLNYNVSSIKSQDINQLQQDQCLVFYILLFDSCHFH